MIEILQAETTKQIEEIRQIFREYKQWLGLDLCFQGFETELADLPGKYAEPDGRLYLADVNGKTAGCIALRKLADGVCEMKRLFIREDFRGLGLGKLLVEKLLEEARLIGYEKMRLDTLPVKMATAVKIYRNFGFEEIRAYYDNPYKETLFMELKL
jgi:carbonic anhydrase